MLKIYSLLFIFFQATLSIAQTTTATIQPVAKNALYKMVVPPEIRANSKIDLSDFRILDTKNNEVPYFFAHDMREKTAEQFEEFPIISKIAHNQKSTEIKIANPKAQINGLKLLVANAEVTKKYNISGSNDQKEWFGLVNNEELSDLKSSETTTITKDISLPLCSYRFLKIVFDDSTTLPINVLKIGNSRISFSKENFQEIKAKSVQTTQLAQEKKTLIKVDFDFPQFIEKMDFEINKAAFFKRNCRVYIEKFRTEKHENVKYQEEIGRFLLVSNQNNSFDISCIQQGAIWIEIENQDNPPLQISDIKFYQKPVFAIADLKSDEHYTIKTGNPNLNAPKYDLEYFKETISDSLPETQITSIEHPKQGASPKQETAFWEQSWFMWLCIGIGGVAILYFSMSLLKDMNKTN